MENKAIQNITREDFIGYWENSDKRIKLYVNGKSYLTIGDKVYAGTLLIEYLADCEECVNCLRLTVGKHSFFIKQINQNGFYLTTEAGEVFISKPN